MQEMFHEWLLEMEYSIFLDEIDSIIEKLVASVARSLNFAIPNYILNDVVWKFSDELENILCDHNSTENIEGAKPIIEKYCKHLKDGYLVKHFNSPEFKELLANHERILERAPELIDEWMKINFDEPAEDWL